MQLVEAGTAPAKDDGGEIREGEQDAKQLLVGRKEGVNNYKMNLTYAVTDWVTPRHHHNFDQIRLTVDGEFVYNKNKILPAGWVGYFPEGVYYDQVRKQGLLLILCQFGGASGNGYMSRERRKAVIEEMRRNGTFEKGSYTWFDANGKRHRKDAYDALWEKAEGRKLDYPPPRYDDTIAMNPANYTWVDKAGSPGVACKWLGTFTERELRVGFVRIESGAQFDFGNHAAPELLFVTQGTVTHGGKTYRKHSAFGFEPFEGPVPIKASEDAEIFCIQLHKFQS